MSELVKRAQRDGPQEITMHGKSVAMVLSRDAFDRLSRQGESLVSFMRKSPLYGLEDIEIRTGQQLDARARVVNYLIDTNVLSELQRKNPDPAVVAWFSAHPAITLYLSVLTLGKIRKGIQKRGDDSRRAHLRRWLEVELPAFFSGRILPIDARVADRWGALLAKAGQPIPAIDSLLAATALEHGLHLVTRNVKDFAALPVRTINPGLQAQGHFSHHNECRNVRPDPKLLFGYFCRIVRPDPTLPGAQAG